MKILLIKPSWYIDGDPMSKFRDFNRVPPLNLGIIAALSEGHEVKIVDADFDRIPYSGEFDLVGITVVTFTARKAYKISQKFRERGVPVVLGGVHPSLMPDEALEFCDAVVVGEAEPVWKQVLADVKRGGLKKIYCADPVDMDRVPIPRRDLYNRKNYRFDAVQFSRGCTNRCRYCYLSSVPWGKFRKRPPQLVYDELKEMKNKNILIVDDNFFLDFEYAKDVMRRMVPLKKRWFIQAPVDIAQDEELLDLMAASGCFAVAIGFESVEQRCLDSLSKYRNKVKDYKKVVDALHKRNILVEGFFIFGLDGESRDIFKKTLALVKEIDLDDVFPYIFVPLPGSELFRRMLNENRLLNRDWSNYVWHRCNFRPLHMSAEELEEGFRWFCEELNRHLRRTLIRRIWKNKKYLISAPYIAGLLLKDAFNKIEINNVPPAFSEKPEVPLNNEVYEKVVS